MACIREFFFFHLETYLNRRGCTLTKWRLITISHNVRQSRSRSTTFDNLFLDIWKHPWWVYAEFTWHWVFLYLVYHWSYLTFNILSLPRQHWIFSLYLVHLSSCKFLASYSVHQQMENPHTFPPRHNLSQAKLDVTLLQVFRIWLKAWAQSPLVWPSIEMTTS